MFLMFFMLLMMMVEMKRVLRVLLTMMNFRTCLHKESCNAQCKLHEFDLRSSKWIERPPGVCEVIGSNPVRDSDFFLCPTLVTRRSFHFHICFTELKIYHLSFF